MPRTFRPPSFTSARAWLPLLVFTLTVLAQWPLWSNPGYFSHDELQWAAAAHPPAGTPVAWRGWFDVQVFQFRPLTFNLWLWQVRSLGEIQAVFSPALVAALRDDPVATPRLQSAPDAEAWIFRRLTHNIPRYRGVAIGERVQLVAPGETAHFMIEADGRLSPMR